MNARHPEFSVSDYGELTACGDPRVLSAANFLSLQASNVDSKPESWKALQAILVQVREDHQISVDALQAILDWHKKENTPAVTGPMEDELEGRVLDFWVLHGILSRDEKYLHEDDEDDEA